MFQNKKMLVNSIQSNEHITLKTGKKKTFGTERSSQSSILPNHKPFTQPKKSESSWSSRGWLEVRKCQFHSNSSEIPTELNEFTEVYKRSFCKETFLESQIMQFSENGFIWKWRIWSGYSAKSYPKERDRHILIFGSMYETESKLSP